MAMEGADTFVGTISSFNGMKGWGFIDSDGAKEVFGKDVFLPKRALGGYNAQVGDQVQFAAIIGQRGGPEAVSVQPLAAGGNGGAGFGGGCENVGAGGGGFDDTTYRGTLASWNPQKGFGFISCAESNAKHGKDAFVMRTEMGPNADAISTGAPLMFKVKVEQRGPVAFDVRPMHGGGAAGAPFGQPPNRGRPNVAPSHQAHQAAGFGPQRQIRPSGVGGPPARFLQQPQAGGAQRAPGEKDVFFGMVKNINSEAGWGHIGCQATEKLYGKDMFVLRTAFEGLTVTAGDMVAFSVQMGPKGPHAKNLRPITVSPQAVYNGTVTSFNTGKGWGFCDSAESQQAYGVDIFMHSREFAPGMSTPTAGDAVQFTVNVTNGRAVAGDVQELGAGPAADNVRFAPY